jgi:hypothetical protein
VAGPTLQQLRVLAAVGALLVLAGAVVGWFERSAAADIEPTVRVVRPGDVLGLGVLAWVVLALPLVAPFVVRSRRAALLALAALLPALVFVVLAAALRPRAAVSGETIGEIVVERTLGQALSLVGVLLTGMALGAAWQKAPDWRVPHAWARDTAVEQ